MHFIRYFAPFLGIASFAAFGMALAYPAPQKYTLTGITFSDNAAATGFFIFDGDKQRDLSYHLTTTSGVTDKKTGAHFSQATIFEKGVIGSVFTFNHSSYGGRDNCRSLNVWPVPNHMSIFPILPRTSDVEGGYQNSNGNIGSGTIQPRGGSSGSITVTVPTADETSFVGAPVLNTIPQVYVETTVTGITKGADGDPISSPGTISAENSSQVLHGNDGHWAECTGPETISVAHAKFTGGRGGGADGAAGATFVVGGLGGSGLLVDSKKPVTVESGTFTGGDGAEASGPSGATTVWGGGGGTGLQEDNGATMTVINGSFTGGSGGPATGRSSETLSGGSGGSGCDVSGPDNVMTSATINGGTFRGGDGAAAAGSATSFGGSGGGSGLAAGNQSLVTIKGGSFAGGSVAARTKPGGGITYDGVPGGGLMVNAGTVNIYGGNFMGGGYASGGVQEAGESDGSYGISIGSGSVTLYGFDFTVNGVANFTGPVPTGTGTIRGRLQNNAAITTINYNLTELTDGKSGTITVVTPSAQDALPSAATHQ